MHSVISCASWSHVIWFLDTFTHEQKPKCWLSKKNIFSPNTTTCFLGVIIVQQSQTCEFVTNYEHYFLFGQHLFRTIHVLKQRANNPISCLPQVRLWSSFYKPGSRSTEFNNSLWTQRAGPGARAECWLAPAGPHSGHPNLGLLSPEAGVTSSVMKWLHCLSDDPGGQVSLFVFNLTKIIGWLKDSFVSRELLNSHTNLLVSLLLSSNPYSHLQD